MQRSEVRYARAGDHHIAYRELVGDSDGDLDVVMVNGATFPMGSLFDDPIATRLVEGLAALGRLIMYDRRGVALSDAITDWETPVREQWSRDLEAVIDVAGCDPPTIFSWQGMAGVVCDYAIRHPDRVEHLVLFNPGAMPETREEWDFVAERFARVKRSQEGPSLGKDSESAIQWPKRWHDPAFRAWWEAAGRDGASPGQAGRLREASMDPANWTVDFAAVTTPTLVITRDTAGDPTPESLLLRVARAIPNVQHVALPPGDLFAVGADVDDILAETTRYLTGEVRLPAPDREVMGILFTDLVASTRRAVAEGDAAWKGLLDRHDDTNRRVVARCGGEVVKSTGDGVLALLPSAAAALKAAAEIRGELRHQDLDVRIGLHIGDVDRRGDDVSGLALHVAARIMSEAGPGQILVSETVALVCDAANLVSLGPRTLDGIDREWTILELT